MNTIGSIKTLQQGITTGFIGYPQRYEIASDPSKSLIHGVDQAGVAFTLELAIPERFIEKAKLKSDVSIPDVASLSETHRKARNPCFATLDNGPQNPTGGAFLAEQVQVVDGGKNHLKANWLSILRDSDDSPAPRSGIGYLEINCKQVYTPEAEEIKVLLTAMNQAHREYIKIKSQADEIMGISTLDFGSQRDELALKLYQLMERKWFIGVDVQYSQMKDLILEAPNAKSIVTDLIGANTVSGMYGGVILRPFKMDKDKKVVVVDSVRRLNHQYDYLKRLVPQASDVWDNFYKKGGSGWLRSMKNLGYGVDVIPVQRINCGKASNEKYAKEMDKGFSKQLKAFVDSRFHHAPYVSFALQNAALASPIAMRNAETRKAEFDGTVLLSSMHSFGKAIGNVLELDKNGERTLELSEIPEPFVKQPSTSRAPTSDYGQDI